MKPNLKEAVRFAVKFYGGEGLCHPDLECGCHLSDFMPCGEPGIACEVAWQGPCLDGEWDFWMFPRQEARDKAISEEIDNAWYEAHVGEVKP